MNLPRRSPVAVLTCAGTAPRGENDSRNSKATCEILLGAVFATRAPPAVITGEREIKEALDSARDSRETRRKHFSSLEGPKKSPDLLNRALFSPLMEKRTRRASGSTLFILRYTREQS